MTTFFFESDPNGTLIGFQIRKIRIWDCIYRILPTVGSADSKYFFGLAQRNTKSIFWIRNLDLRLDFEQRNAPLDNRINQNNY